MRLVYSPSRLRSAIKPFRLHWFSRLRSTSDHAARLRRAGKLYAPSLVLTSHQTHGRGRGSNTWWSGSGVLTATFALAVQERLAPQELPLIAGLAVRQAAVELCGRQDILLKWPNDVICDGLKLAGLLCERVSNVDLVGIGLNVNSRASKAPRELREKIVSLSEILGKPIDMNDAVAALAAHLHSMTRRRMEQSFAVFVREYARHDALIGRAVTVTSPGDGEEISGRCEGLDEQGRLIVRQHGVRHRIVAGTITPR